MCFLWFYWFFLRKYSYFCRKTINSIERSCFSQTYQYFLLNTRACWLKVCPKTNYFLGSVVVVVFFYEKQSISLEIICFSQKYKYFPKTVSDQYSNRKATISQEILILFCRKSNISVDIIEC